MGEEVATRCKRSVTVLAAVPLLVGGCGVGHDEQAVPQPKHCRAGSVRPLGSNSTAFTAAVLTRARAFRHPGLHPFARFGRYNAYGVRTVLGVRAAVVRRDCRPAWYRVHLPVKPNGAVGYVRAREVRVGRVTARIAVDLSDRRLTYFRNGRVVLRARVGIGSSQTPTPTGHFYVNQRFREDPAGPYGPAAIGISAYSEVLTWWADGGPIAIHGTNRPWTIGRAASNGCLHVPNAIARRLFRVIPAGTPVDITA